MTRKINKINPIGICSAIIVAALSLSSASASFFSGDASDGDRFLNRDSEGWFWYEVQPEDIEPILEEKPLPEIVTSEQKKPETPPVAQATPETKTQKPFSAAWVRENLPKYRDLAWDNPTPENLRAYLYLQRFVLDKAQQFTDAWELAVVGDPLIDEIARRPVANFATPHVNQKGNKEQKALLKEIAKKVGVFFFFSSECEMCDVQAPVLNMLKTSADFTVIPISVDGKALKSGLFPEFKVDNGHSTVMNVKTLPATFLVMPDGKFESIGQGVMSLTEINRRLLVAAKRNNWVSKERFDKTRPVLNMENNLAEVLIDVENFNELLPASKDQTNSEDNQGFVEPEKLVNFFREKMNVIK